MQTVKGFIASKQRELDAHPLLDQVRRDEPGIRGRLAPRLASPAMVLKDVTREMAQLVADPALGRVARELCARAARRDGRFLRAPSEVARLASHGLASQTELATDDACRIALLLALDSAGEALLLVEDDRAPAVLGEEADATLASVALPASTRRLAIALVNRCYLALSAMLDDIERALAESPAAPAPAPAPAWARALSLSRSVTGSPA